MTCEQHASVVGEVVPGAQAGVVEGDEEHGILVCERFERTGDINNSVDLRLARMDDISHC